MKIRKATPEETDALVQIANDAKRYWGYPEHWIEHWQRELTISADSANNSDTYVAEEDQQVLGFYSLAIRDAQMELDQIWVSPAQLGRGVGKELFFHAMQITGG